MPVNLLITAGTVEDCTQAAALLDGIPLDAAAAEYLLTDRGCDTNRVMAAAQERGMTPVIPPQRKRNQARGNKAKSAHHRNYDRLFPVCSLSSYSERPGPDDKGLIRNMLQ